MHRFSQLYEALDATTKTNAKVEALAAYFRAVPAEDAAWAVFFLTGQRLTRLVSGRTLREWARYEFRMNNRDQATRMWQEAREIFAKLGADMELQRMSDLPE